MPNHMQLALATLGLAISSLAVGADNIEALARTCNNCHGVNGVSVGPTMPSIGGLSETYLKTIMLQWKTGERASATMGRLLKGYTDEQLSALATHFAKLPWTPAVQQAGADVLKKGKDVNEACETCHGATGSEPDDENTPRLNGQWARYMELELMKYRDKDFVMTHKKMIKSSRKLEDAEVPAISQFFGAQAK